MKRTHAAGLMLGFLLGIAISVAPTATASRNGSGTYSLPNTASVPNPVVTGTTISSTWANTTLSDIATELTSSLDRAGRGAMTAPLQLASGVSGAPSLTFSAEPTTGLFRAAANDIQFQVAGVTHARFTDGNNTFTGTSNGIGASCFGDGSGAGVYAVGGSSNASGVWGVGGATNGKGVLGVGTGTGPGVYGSGGSANAYGVVAVGGGTSGAGIYSTGGSATDGGAGGPGGFFVGGTNGHGVHGQAAGSGYAGGSFVASSTSDGTTRTDSVKLSGGDLVFDTPVAPASTTAISNRLTAGSFAKAWATVNSGAGAGLINGLNIASVSCSTNVINVYLASGVTTYSPSIVTLNSNVALHCWGINSSTTAFSIGCYDAAGAVHNLCAGSIYNLSIVVFGNQ